MHPVRQALEDKDRGSESSLVQLSYEVFRGGDRKEWKCLSKVKVLNDFLNPSQGYLEMKLVCQESEWKTVCIRHCYSREQRSLC